VVKRRAQEAYFNAPLLYKQVLFLCCSLTTFTLKNLRTLHQLSLGIEIVVVITALQDAP
jgi:hypothetical protein